jgi:hypothetical protein
VRLEFVGEGLRAVGVIGTLTPVNGVASTQQYLCRDTGCVLVEVRGTNNSPFTRGAVGVVTRTPTGDQINSWSVFLMV